MQVWVCPSLKAVEEGKTASHIWDGLDGRLVMSLPMALVKTRDSRVKTRDPLQVRANFGATFPAIWKRRLLCLLPFSTVGSARERNKQKAQAKAN